MTAYVPPYASSLLDWQRQVSTAINPLFGKVGDLPGDVVADFGADPTGASDSLAAFNSAFASGRGVFIPEGSYFLSACPTAPTGSLRMVGAGKGKTILLIAHNGARALYFTPASTNNRVELSDFTLQASCPTGPCPLGIEIAFPSTTSYPYQQVKLDVEFRTNLASTGPTWANTWGRGVRLTNVWYPRLVVNGSSAPIAGDTGNTGFLEVTGGSYGCVGPNIEAVWYFGADFIRASAYIEGVYIRDSEAVGVTRGLYVPATTPNGGSAALYRAQSVYFINSHIAAQSAAFDLDNVLDFRSVSNNIQRWQDASATNWTGYKLNNVQYPQIIGGTIAGNDASGGITTLGISGTASLTAHGIVSGVHFENLDTQFNLDASTSHWTIRGNVSTGATPDVYSVAGTLHDIEWLGSGGFVQRNVTALGINTSALGNFATDAAAAAGGVAIGQYYRNGSAVMVRIT